MGFIFPWDDSIDIIAIEASFKILVINPMDLSDPRDYYIDIITLKSVKKY